MVLTIRPRRLDGRFDQFIDMGVEPRARPRLVLAHEPGITGHIGGEDGGEATVDGVGGHGSDLFLRQASFAEAVEQVLVCCGVHVDVPIGTLLQKAGMQLLTLASRFFGLFNLTEVAQTDC